MVPKRKRSKRRQSRPRHHHVELTGFTPASFAYTLQRKDRNLYLSNLRNGDTENWFGQVIGGNPGNALNINLALPNTDLAAAGSATLEFAVQGVLTNPGEHVISVAFNGNTVASLDFFGLAYVSRTVSIPISQLLSGNNTLTFTKVSGGDASLVDYVRVTYPHLYKADSGSLKFSLLDTQSVKVDGFATSSVRLIDYTDPFNVGFTPTTSEPTAAGFAITVPVSETRVKAQRLLYAIPEGHFEQPAALSINQPSTLNLNTNAGDFVVISHRTFMPSFTTPVPPSNTTMVAQRIAQGMTVQVIDIEDVYDEFSFGVHGPQAIKDFLLHASTHWIAGDRPQYVIFAGDASLDPRNYQAFGNFDFVPTKLIDTIFNETASDDWLADFDNNGIANIPVGRLPFRNVADATLLISKIVNFTPSSVPQGALLVADAQFGYYYNFEQANDEIGALVQPSLAVQKVVRQTAAPGCVPNPPFSSCQQELDANTTNTLITKMNDGQAVINYSGHGNVDAWGAGASIFRATHASALTNGSNKLFVVVVMDCLNAYFQDPLLVSFSEAFIKSPNGGAVAAFASSGLTFPEGQHEMAEDLYTLLYGPNPIALGDAIKTAKSATGDVDVRRTWILFGDPSLKIR